MIRGVRRLRPVRGREAPSVPRRGRFLLVGGLLLAALALALLASTSWGEVAIAPGDVLRAAFSIESGDPRHAFVVRTLRLPRVLLALLVGAALALSGGILQGVSRNDLADPGILGINAGAGVMALWYLTQVTAPPLAPLPWFAFLGAATTALLIYGLAWRGGSSPLRLILVGIGVAALLNALIGLWIIRADLFQAQAAMVWLAGSLYGSDWAEVRLIVAWLLPLALLLLLSARRLNALALGDEVAAGLGVPIERARGTLIAMAAALAAVSVSVAGTIGFVGFAAPHIARRLVGPSHGALLPITALVGALLLVVADLIARALLAPNELPVGVVTAILGAPYFAYLLLRQGK